MERQRKSKSITAFVILLLLVTVASVIIATYAWAKYRTTVEAQGATAEVAKWKVVTDQNGQTFYTNTYTQVVDERIAPGTSGKLAINLDVTGTEVGVDYTITLVSVEPVTSETTGEAGIIPTNLIIKDEKNAIIYQKKSIQNGGVIASNEIAKDASNKKVTSYLNWEWPFQTGESAEDKATNDGIDTTDGEKAGSFKVTYKIDVVQHEPVAE